MMESFMKACVYLVLVATLCTIAAAVEDCVHRLNRTDLMMINQYRQEQGLDTLVELP